MDIRGVPKIADDSSRIASPIKEVDANTVREFVTNTFQRMGLSPPYSIKFTPGRGSEAIAYFEEERLHVTASSVSELKRLVGRFVIEESWSRREWLLATRAGAFSAVACFIMIALTVVAATIASLSIPNGFWVVLSITVVISGVAFWTSYQMAEKSHICRRNLAIQMDSLGCITEYDGKDYEEQGSLIVHSSAILAMLGALLVMLIGLTFYSDYMHIFGIEFGLLLLVAVVFLFSKAFRLMGTNLCFEDEDYADDDEDPFEDSEYLQTAFSDVIDRLNIRDSIAAREEAEFTEIRGRFLEVMYPQCRYAYDYIEEETLFVDVADISEEAAKRLGAAYLAKASLRYYTELSFERRSIMLIAFIYGLIMLVAVIIAGLYGILPGIVATLVTSATFSAMWQIGWKQNQEIRSHLPQLLEKTEVFNEYELDFYENYMYNISSRFDLSFLVGFNLILFVLEAFMIYLTLTNF